MTIHPSAIVSPDAELADDVTIGPFAIIESGVKIGAGTSIGPGSHISTGTTIGKNNKIHMYAVIGNEPQDWHWEGEPSFVSLGDGNTIREFVTIHRGTQPGSTTTLGDNNNLMATSHVAHNCTLGDKITLANGVLLAGHVEVGSNAFISGNAVVHQFCRVGRNVMIAGGARITRDAPPFATLHSENRMSGLNRIGLSRAGFKSKTISDISRAYRKMFMKGEPPKSVAKELANSDEPCVVELANFILSSERGLCSHGHAK